VIWFPWFHNTSWFVTAATWFLTCTFCYWYTCAHKYGRAPIEESFSASNLLQGTSYKNKIGKGVSRQQWRPIYQLPYIYNMPKSYYYHSGNDTWTPTVPRFISSPTIPCIIYCWINNNEIHTREHQTIRRVKLTHFLDKTRLSDTSFFRSIPTAAGRRKPYSPTNLYLRPMHAISMNRKRDSIKQTVATRTSFSNIILLWLDFSFLGQREQPELKLNSVQILAVF
jgi:hypothetical protein